MTDYPYSKMSQTDFDDILMEILSDWKASQLIDLPDIYEILSEEFNNKVLDIWSERQAMEKEES